MKLPLRKSIFVFSFAVGAGAFLSTSSPVLSGVPDEVVQVSTQVPTANLLPSRTRTLPPTHTVTPSRTLTPTDTLTSTPTLTLTPTLTPSLTPTRTMSPTVTTSQIPSATLITLDASYTQPPTWTPPPANPASQIADHYVFARPFSSNATNWIARTYPYGGTSGGRLQVHHGVDIQNPAGVSILAPGDGVVAYAGDDLTTLFAPITNYYGNLVVIQHNFNTPEGEPLFTLYGHMSYVSVQTGQAVQTGDVLGAVGGTGVAQGPHLHFEVRVGDFHNFDATRNPDLWIRPFQTFGTLAGRVTDADGNSLYEVTLTVQSTEITRYTFSYADNTVHGDPTFNENFTLGDLPANYYTVTVSDGNRARFQEIVYVYPNRTTWLDVQLNR